MKTSTFQQPNADKIKKKIEVVKFINSKGYFEAATKISNYDNCILLISSALSTEDYDTMYAYNNNLPNAGCIYLGHWNDGVV